MATGLTAYDLPAAPIVPGEGAPPKGESYWDLVLHQFRKNRLAVISFFFVLCLFAIAIGAPFLADNKPIVFRGAYPSLYRDTFQEWKQGGHPELIAALQAVQSGGAGDTAAQLPARLATVERQLRKLAEQLPSDRANGFDAYLDHYRKAIQSGQSKDAGGVAAALDILSKDYDQIAEQFDGAEKLA